MWCERSRASSHASPRSSQLTDRGNDAGMCPSAYLSAPPPPPPPPPHRRPSPPSPPLRRCRSEDRLPRTAGSPPPASLTGCARRRSWRRWTSGSWWSPSQPLSLQTWWDRGRRGGGEENFGSACVTGLVVSSADRAEPLVRFLCREIRCVIPTGPSHQPVSARRLQRVWVLEPSVQNQSNKNQIHPNIW